MTAPKTDLTWSTDYIGHRVANVPDNGLDFQAEITRCQTTEGAVTWSLTISTDGAVLVQCRRATLAAAKAYAQAVFHAVWVSI